MHSIDTSLLDPRTPKQLISVWTVLLVFKVYTTGKKRVENTDQGRLFH